MHFFVLATTVHGYREFKTLTYSGNALWALHHFRSIVHSHYLTQSRNLQDHKQTNLRVVISDDHSTLNSVDTVSTWLARVCG